MPHVLHTIWIDSHEPTNPDTLWIKPIKEGAYAIYVYGVKGWTMITAEFKGTIGELIVSQLPEATPESNGVMSAEDKAKLDALGIYYGSTEYWEEQKYFVPPAGTIVVYTDYETIMIDDEATTFPGIKIGNGNAYVQELAFVSGGLREDLLKHINEAISDFVTTDSLNTALAEKQNNISDLSEIREGAAAGKTAYQKPSTGIPSADMTEAVRTSLAKADSALQEHQRLKTINGESILGEGDLQLSEPVQSDWDEDDDGDDAYIKNKPTIPTNVVKYTEQTLTDSQKEQARTNIAAASESEVSQLRSDVDENSSKISRLPIYYTTPTDDGLYVSDGRGNLIAKITQEGMSALGYKMPNVEMVDDAMAHFVLCDAAGNVVFEFDANTGVLENLQSYFLKLNGQPALSWIDDDFNVLSGGVIKPEYDALHQWCEDNDVTIDFAYGPSAYSTEKDTSATMQLVKTWEEEGFGFLMHPKHQGWYDYGTTYVHDIALVKSGIVNCIRHFHLNNLVSKCNILVWPGSSNSYPDNVAVIRNYVDCAILASKAGFNPGITRNRYQLQRYTINVSADHPKSLIKAEIKNRIDAGDWVILETHIDTCSESMTLDETTNNIGNVLDIAEYCNGLCPIEHTETIWRRKKVLYDMFNK